MSHSALLHRPHALPLMGSVLQDLLSLRDSTLGADVSFSSWSSNTVLLFLSVDIP